MLGKHPNGTVNPIPARSGSHFLTYGPSRRSGQPSGYDGGDCCECTCDPTIQYGCDFYFDPADCIDPSAPCVNNYIEAGSKTTVGVSANAYDTRPGLASNMVGCQEDGCSPSLTRDGISDDIESRWSCAQAIVPDGGFCEIMFTFESPQDIVDIQVAFPYDDESARSLEVSCTTIAICRYSHQTRVPATTTTVFIF